MTRRPDFIQHQALARFVPHLQSYALKGLQKPNSNGGVFKATEIERYAANVFERVGELDNSIASLRLAVKFVLDLNTTHEDAPEVYRYHYENFLLRLTGIVDRAHLLIGASLTLCPSKLKKIGANEFVSKSIAPDYPELHGLLKMLGSAAARHKKARNEVAHSNAFSTRELGLFSAIASLNIEVGDQAQINELMGGYFLDSCGELSLLVAEMVEGIDALLGALAPIYEDLFDGNA